MRIDPAVCRAKFELEVARLRGQTALLRAWGCWIDRAEYPVVDLVVVPRPPMKLTGPFQQSSIIALPTGGYATKEIDVLAARAFGVRISMDDYDQRATSVTFHDAWTWEPLPFQKIPCAHNRDEHGAVFQVLQPEHPETHRPFLCVRGIREYHEHPQHTGDDWALYRRDMGLFSIVTTIWRTCVELAQPILVIAPAGLQLRWTGAATR